MKNTLAENMLRFGVKNLHKSDVKKIQEVATLSEININGVEYKYPFKDENQMGQYAGLMKFDRNYATTLMGSYEGLSALHMALTWQVAIEGIMPGKLPAEMAGAVARRYANTPDQYRPMMEAALKNPKWTTWYNRVWLPQWKKAYLTVFPPQPAGAATTQAPQTPGKM